MASELVTLAERYVLETPIARGGMGTVWRARDEVLARPVAVKVLHPELAEDEAFVQRFRREALAAARLSHPNIVAIYDTGSEAGADGIEQHFIVMEHCGGGTLADVISDEGPIDPGRAASMGRAICSALAYAHRHGIVHRDVKPGNVLVTEDGTLKVGDFGIAKAAFQAGDLTTTGSILGTVTYISPEQADGREPDSRSDLYALGVVLYEAVTGRPPFSDEVPVATAMKHLREPPPPPRSLRAGIPRSIESVILRALEKEPDARYPTAEAMGEALEGHGSGESTNVMPLPGRTTPRRSPQGQPSGTPDLRWVGPVMAIVVVVLLLAVGLPALLEQREEAGNGSGEQQGQGNNGGETSQIEIEGATDFDPHGTDGEHPQDVPNTFDGDPNTGWQTQNYNDALSLLKPGVGIVYDLGEEQAVRTIEIDGSIGSFEIRAAPEQGGDETDFEVVTNSGALDGSEVIDVGGTEARYWLIWITDLPGGSGGRATISEVTFLGA